MVGVAIDGNTTNGGYTSPGKTGVKTQFSFVSVFKQATTGTNNYPQLMSLGDSFNSVALATNSSAGGQLGILFPGIKALSEVSFTAGVVSVVVGSHDTATGEFYTKIRPLNGGAITAARGNNTVAAASLSGTNRVGICRTDFGGSWNGNIYLAAAGLFFLTEGQSELYLHNPWQLFAPQRTPSFFGAAGGGGTTYNISISETASASEIAGAIATFLASISETATASETVATTAVLNASISETATASETVAAAASFVVTIGETATASETVAMALGAATFAVDISETATASETVSMLATFGTSISETATASETVSMLATFLVGISETATASETVAMQLANQTYAVDISETATASDTVVMTIPTTYAISIIETVQAGDYVSMGVPSSDFWTQVTTTQSAGWGQINNTQSSGWTIIPTT